MAAPDDQLPKPGSSPPVTSSPTPDSIVPTNAQTAPSTLGARSAFTQEQWQQRIAPNNTPQADPATNTPLSINDDPAFMRIREEANARDQKRFTAGMRGGWSSERIEAELKGTRQRVTDSALQSFVASYPTKALAYAQTDRSAADAVTRYVKDNSTLVKTPGYGDLVEFAKTHTKAQQAESERKSEAFHKRLADEARAEQERRDRLWGRASSSSPKQAVTPPSPIEKAAAPENKSPLPPPGKTQRSPQFIGNVNVGAQKSKFNEFNARAIAFQQGLAKPQHAQVPVPTQTKPKTNKALTAAGMGVMGAAGVGKILIDAGRKGLESAYVSPSSNPDTSKLEYLKKGWEDWREILRRHAGLSEVRTLERFRLWLQENPNAQGPKGVLSDKNWSDHDDYQDYLRLDEENKRKAQAETQDQPRKKPAQHTNEEYYSRPHYSLSDDVGEEESPNETQAAQTKSQSTAPPRPIDPSPSPENNSSQTQQDQPTPRRRQAAPRSPGRGMLPGARRALGGVVKIGRLAAFMWPWGTAIIVITIILFVIFRPDAPDTLAHNGEITISTGNTKVKNAEFTSALGASIGPTGEKGVLGVIDDITNILKGGLEKLKELAQKHKDSLITYTITASYDGPAREITVSYPIPKDTMLINASGVYKEEKGKDETTGVEKTTKITWLFTENSGSTPSTAASVPINSNTASLGISFTKYTQAPYFLPAPQSGSDTNYSSTTIAALNQLGSTISQNQTYLQTKHPAQYIDPFLSVIWVGAIEGIGDNPYFWNCKDDRSITINMGCPGGYYSGGWQVGYGIQVAQVSGHLASDFDAIYGAGSANNAAKVKEVGQAVIAKSAGKITNPSTFPQETISSLVTKANSGNQVAQQAIAILLMDQKLGAINIALEVAGDIRSQNNWAQTMRGWGAYYRDNMQNFSNRAKAIADKYSGQGGSGGNTGSGGTFAPKSFTVTILPLLPNIVVDSGIATMDVDEIAGSTSTTATDSGMTSGDMGDGRHVPPSTNSCGKYSLSSNPAGKNYGDPTCNYEKNKLFDMLKRLDSANANLWFNKVIPCESAYDPNTFYRSGAQGDTPDPYGAWGLFQMGRGVNGPFTDLTKGSTNNPALPEDRGDVNWELQVSNAVNFNKKYLSSKGRPMGDYWACAR